ncbi:MAG: transposase [Tunicatimonas sp.]|uniref:transposase n=1 Tax=Tunicatimonas sp. TaxID=1940096 RepID=UPI003C742D30
MKPKEEKKFSAEFISQFKSEEDVSAYFGDMYKAVIEQMLEGEMEGHLGYAPHDRQTDKKGNYRNGKKSKQVRSKLGTLNVSVPQDRQSSFTPQVVPKRHSVMADLEDRALSFYANGMSTRDIATQMEDIYGAAAARLLFRPLRYPGLPTGYWIQLRNGRHVHWMHYIWYSGWMAFASGLRKVASIRPK